MKGVETIAIDGKTLRHSYDKTHQKAALHLVSAWASESRLVLAQTPVDKKSNEITAIPQLLEMLALEGCLVTIDAMGCQTEIAQQIIDQHADYVLALKGNQRTLYYDAQTLFQDAQAIDFADCDYHKTVNKDHGRVEIRECWVTTHPEYLDTLYKAEQWAGLKSVVMVRTERRFGDKRETETRYYISSLPGSARQHANAIRDHWHIENRLHWVLDVSFRQDDCRIRTGQAPQNMAVLRHMALNLIKRECSRGSVRGKRLKAGWDDAFLAKILAGI